MPLWIDAVREDLLEAEGEGEGVRLLEPLSSGELRSLRSPIGLPAVLNPPLPPPPPPPPAPPPPPFEGPFSTAPGDEGLSMRRPSDDGLTNRRSECDGEPRPFL